MPATAAVSVTAGRLAVSKAPAAELAAAAIRAQKATGAEPRDVEYIVVAVPIGTATPKLVDRVAAAAA